MKRLLLGIIILFELKVYGVTFEYTHPNNLVQDTTVIRKKITLGSRRNTSHEYDLPNRDATISRIDTALPTIARIKQDLVGHFLAEGLPNGYHSDDWVWLIEDGQIEVLEIIEILEETDENYIFVANMILSATYYSYNVKAKIKYTKTSINSWGIDYVLSLGMNIKVTHEYDECVKTSIVDDGWGGVNCVQFNNISEMTLAVGGDYLTYNGWRRFSTVITPHSSSSIGGTFSGGSVKDYRINFVVRIN